MLSFYAFPCDLKLNKQQKYSLWNEMLSDQFFYSIMKGYFLIEAPEELAHYRGTVSKERLKNMED